MNATNTDAIRDPQSTSQPFLDDSEDQSGAAAGAYLREQCTEPVDDIFEPGATAANATPSDTLKFELAGDLLPAAACAIELFPADGDVLRKLSNADKDPYTAASKKARIIKNLQRCIISVDEKTLTIRNEKGACKAQTTLPIKLIEGGRAKARSFSLPLFYLRKLFADSETGRPKKSTGIKKKDESRLDVFEFSATEQKFKIITGLTVLNIPAEACPRPIPLPLNSDRTSPIKIKTLEIAKALTLVSNFTGPPAVETLDQPEGLERFRQDPVKQRQKEAEHSMEQQQRKAIFEVRDYVFLSQSDCLYGTGDRSVKISLQQTFTHEFCFSRTVASRLSSILRRLDGESEIVVRDERLILNDGTIQFEVPLENAPMPPIRHTFQSEEFAETWKISNQTALEAASALSLIISRKEKVRLMAREVGPARELCAVAQSDIGTGNVILSDMHAGTRDDIPWTEGSRGELYFGPFLAAIPKTLNDERFELSLNKRSICIKDDSQNAEYIIALTAPGRHDKGSVL